MASPSQQGILLINLGTPDAPNVPSLRRYLAQFLGDRRVIEVNRWLWLPILHGIILRTRPKESAEKYRKIWTKAGSPLRVTTEQQCRLLRETLATVAPGVPVEYGMRYGNPSVAHAIDALLRQGVTDLIVLPLYPQYAASTTGSSFDAVFRHLMTVRNVPAVRTIHHFYDHPAYLTALKKHVTDFWANDGKPDRLLISFHGAPKQTHDDGDPYYTQCLDHVARFNATMGDALDGVTVSHSFQSRFGRTEWLQPYTTDALRELGAQHVGRVDVLCLSFVADCLETLEEINLVERDTFLNAGGGAFRLIPCLNENPAFISALAEILTNSQFTIHNS
jgi:ferrochelatase